MFPAGGVQGASSLLTLDEWSDLERVAWNTLIAGSGLHPNYRANDGIACLSLWHLRTRGDHVIWDIEQGGRPI